MSTSLLPSLPAYNRGSLLALRDRGCDARCDAAPPGKGVEAASACACVNALCPICCWPPQPADAIAIAMVNRSSGAWSFQPLSLPLKQASLRGCLAPCPTRLTAVTVAAGARDLSGRGQLSQA